MYMAAVINVILQNGHAILGIPPRPVPYCIMGMVNEVLENST
jgi:hypothetical protein